ncbi:MAG: hypothetical protein RRY99_06045 [Flavobacterium sp.]
MSQPVGIIAKIEITEDSFKKYIRKTASDILAQKVFEAIKKRDNRDFYVFKYIKKQNALYAFFYFNYGNDQFVLQHPMLKMLQEIEPHLAKNSNSYLIGTCDSLNFSINDFVYAASTVDGKFADHKFTPQELKDCKNDADKYFFKIADIDYTLAYPKALEINIVKKVKILNEMYRVQMLKTNLHIATLEKPVEFFTGYFYNGKQFYTTEKNNITIFDNINLQELHQTPYGVCDDKHIIIGNKCIKTDPKKFKIHQKGETCYYSSAEGVYNEKLEPYLNSDGLSFRMISEYLSEDKNYIYFAGLQLSKQEIGNYKVNTSGYIYQNALLYNKKQVRTNNIILEDIDASTFEILFEDGLAFRKLYQLPNPSRVISGCFILHCRDKKGEFIIHNYCPPKTKVIVERISSLEKYISKTRVLLLEMEGKR